MYSRHAPDISSDLPMDRHSLAGMRCRKYFIYLSGKSAAPVTTVFLANLVGSVAPRQAEGSTRPTVAIMDLLRIPPDVTRRRCRSSHRDQSPRCPPRRSTSCAAPSVGPTLPMRARKPVARHLAVQVREHPFCEETQEMAKSIARLSKTE